MNWALRIFILWVSTAQAGCDAPSNPVEAENCLPGSSEGDWRPQNTDPSIVGFASEISVNAGEIIFFKVDTDASNYRFDIYRLGYYGGSGARLIKTLSPFGPAQRQQACFEEGDFIDCGNWEVSAFWDIPADAVSGVYWVKLVRQDTGGENYFFFIVRNDVSRSSVLYQTSDPFLLSFSSGNAASYNRPAGFESVRRWMRLELPALVWLEANGHDLSYCAAADADRRAELISNHKIFIIPGLASGAEAMKQLRWESGRFSGLSMSHRTLIRQAVGFNEASGGF